MNGGEDHQQSRGRFTGKPWVADFQVAVGYLALAAFKLLCIPTVAVWPSVGVAFAAAFLLGDRAWRGIFAGALLANFAWAAANQVPMDALKFAAVAGIAIGNVLAAVLGARALRWSTAGRNPFAATPDVLRFCTWGAGTLTLVSTLVACTANRPLNPLNNYRTWAFTDYLGAIVFSPAIILWARSKSKPLRRAEALEMGLVVVLTLALAWLLFSPYYASLDPIFRLVSWLLIPLVWASVRFDQKISATLVAASFVIIWRGTAENCGPFAEVADPKHAIRLATVFSDSVAIILLLVSAIYQGRKRALEELFLDISERKRAEEALRHQMAFDEIINKFLSRLASSTGAGMDECINTTLREVAGFIGVDSAIVIKIAPDFTNWSCVYEWSAPGFPCLCDKYQKVPMGLTPRVEQMLLAGEVVQGDTIASIPPESAEERRRWEADGFKSVLRVPLRGRGGPVNGCIALISFTREIAWLQTDIQRLQTVSDALANALERKRADEALRLQAEFDELISRILTLFAEGDGAQMDGHIQSGLREMARFMGADQALLFEASPDFTTVNATHEWRATGSAGVVEPRLKVTAETDPWVNQMLVAGAVFQMERLADLPPEAAALRSRWEARGVEAVLLVPFRGRGGSVTGSIGLFSLARKTWIEADIQRLKMAGDTFANALERKRAEEREHWRNRILESLTAGASLTTILKLIVNSVEAEDPDALCSVHLLDQSGRHLLHATAPSLPDFFNQAIHGREIGEGRGTCGTAAATGKRVITEDILTHPYWHDYRELARKANVRSCWSEPIISSHGKVLGTFAIYHRVVRAPGNEQIQLIKFAASLASLAIERRQAEEGLQKSRQQLRALSARLQSSREQERTHIAREIHDHLGQLLTALKFDLHSLERKVAGVGEAELRAALNAKITSVRELTDETITSVQKIASELRPAILDRLGLEAAIEVESAAFESRTGIHCRWSHSDIPPAIPSESATALFRIFQEILTNVARHAHATEVAVRLNFDDEEGLELKVSDDGAGIQESDLESPKSLGLLGMRERAEILGGGIQFKRNEDKGTTVTVRLPLAGKVEVSA